MAALAAGQAERGVQSLLRHDRIVVAGCLAILTVTAWAYITVLARRMGGMDMEMAMPRMQPWSLSEVLLLWVMWAIMMVAMMLPSAAPVILLFTSVQRRRKQSARPYVPTAVFVSGYLLLWTFYSVLAALIQVGLHQAALLSPGMASSSAWFAGALLIGAALYQLTPLKTSCLSTCRSPIDFISTQWREGTGGALKMGLRHGAYCVGCCWALMVLLFVAGVMNLLWIVALACLVLIEKLAPRGLWIARVSGTMMLVAGAWLWVSAAANLQLPGP